MFDVAFWVNTIINITIGLVVGILVSIIFWWVFSHILVPNIHFEDIISKSETGETKSGIKYRLAFRNLGSRAIIDVEIIVKLVIKSINIISPDNDTIFSIPLGYNRLARIESKKIPHRHITRLDVHKIEELTNTHFSNIIGQLFENNPTIHKDLKTRGIDIKDFEGDPNLLEHLLRLDEEASLQVYIFGYDEFSGARKLFGPKIYKITDIKQSKFRRLPHQHNICVRQKDTSFSLSRTFYKLRNIYLKRISKPS